MSWIILTTLAVSSRAMYSLASRLLSMHIKVSPNTQAILYTGIATILSVLIIPFLGGLSFPTLSSAWVIILLMMLSQGVGNVLYFKGQEQLDAGTTQIAFSSIVIWGVLLSIIFLQSHFSLFQFVGILLLIVAIILTQYKKHTFKLTPAVLYIFFSTACFAIFQVTSAELSKTMSAGTYLPLAYGGSTLIVVLLSLKQFRKDIPILLQNKINVVQKGLFASSTSLLYFVFSFFAYAKAPDRGVVVLLLTTQVIVSVILGIIFLKEREGIKRKLFAGVIAVVASILIQA